MCRSTKPMWENTSYHCHAQIVASFPSLPLVQCVCCWGVCSYVDLLQHTWMITIVGQFERCSITIGEQRTQLCCMHRLIIHSSTDPMLFRCCASIRLRHRCCFAVECVIIASKWFAGAGDRLQRTHQCNVNHNLVVAVHTLWPGSCYRLHEHIALLRPGP